MGTERSPHLDVTNFLVTCQACHVSLALTLAPDIGIEFQPGGFGAADVPMDYFCGDMWGWADGFLLMDYGGLSEAPTIVLSFSFLKGKIGSTANNRLPSSKLTVCELENHNISVRQINYYPCSIAVQTNEHRSSFH